MRSMRGRDRVGGGVRGGWWGASGLVMWAAAGGVGAASSAALAQWAPESWRAARLGYFDSVHTRNDGQQQSFVTGQAPGLDGLTVGMSERYQGEAYVGSSAWAQSRGRPVTRLGFFDGVHTGADGQQDSAVGANVGPVAGRLSSMNLAGQAIGISARYLGNQVIGQSAWIWGPERGVSRVGLWTGAFVGPAGEQESRPVEFDQAGRVVGYSVRFDAAEDPALPPAASAWRWAPGSGAEVIGLIDSVHVRADGYQRHEPRGMNNAGLVVGVSSRFDVADPTNPGQSAWTWREGTGASRIGLTGTRYVEPESGFQYTYVLPPTPAGDVAGATYSFAAVGAAPGRDAWVRPSGSSGLSRLGFTDAIHTNLDGSQRSEPTALSVNGSLRVLGYSARYNQVFGYPDGRSAWSWAPGEGLIDIGLKDAAHTGSGGERDSFAIFYKGDRFAVGLGARYDGVNFRTGQSAWVWTAPTPTHPQGQTRQIGLTDALHTSLEGFRRSEVYGATDSGYVYGVSYRYNGRFDPEGGRTIWVYNVDTQTQVELVFSQAASGDAVALPLGMSEAGVLTGYYLEYAGDEIVAQRAFVWDASRGGETVNALLAGGPLANGMENAFFGSTFEEETDFGVVYAMPPGVIWTPAGIGSWAVAYRLDRAGPACDPDLNQDGVADQGDVDYLVNAIAGGGNPSGVNADFNNDGVADQGDVDALVNVVAGGGCP